MVLSVCLCLAKDLTSNTVAPRLFVYMGVCTPFRRRYTSLHALGEGYHLDGCFSGLTAFMEAIKRLLLILYGE